jgi:hypothetical protein
MTPNWVRFVILHFVSSSYIQFRHVSAPGVPPLHLGRYANASELPPSVDVPLNAGTWVPSSIFPIALSHQPLPPEAPPSHVGTWESPQFPRAVRYGIR